MKTSLRPSRRARQRGAALMEFAIATPLLLLVVSGLVEYGFYYYVSVNAAAAAREGARQCTLVSLGACGQCNPTEAVDHMDGMGLGDRTKATATCNTVSGTYMYTVNVEVDFPTLTGLMTKIGAMPGSDGDRNALAHGAAVMRGQ